MERLDLLRTHYEGRCAWTEGAESETHRGAADLPYLDTYAEEWSPSGHR